MTARAVLHLARGPRLGGGLALALLSAVPVMAQDGPGGVQYRFGVEQRFESDDNYSLRPGGQDRTTRADTHLSLGIVSQTRISQFSLQAMGLLRASNGPGLGAAASGFQEPSVTVSYSREAADARFNARAYLREQSLNYLRGLEDFLQEDGSLDLPEDLGTLTAEGSRRSAGAELSLAFAQNAPIAWELGAGVNDVSYVDTDSALLHDYRRLQLNGAAVLRLSPASRLRLGLGRSRYESAAPGARDRDQTDFDLGYIREMPDGYWSAGLSHSKVEEGSRSTLSFGRVIELPIGNLTARAGVTRLVNRDYTLTGELRYARELPDGGFSLRLHRTAEAANDDSERLITALAAQYHKDLTPTAALTMDLTAARSEITASGVQTDNLIAGIGLHQQLTADWGLGFGVRHRIRSQDGAPRARSNSVWASLSRNFDFRF